MAKKNNNVFFNLFNAENGFEEENQNSNNIEVSSTEEHFVSIAHMDIDEPKQEPVSGQTTMFEDDNFKAFFDDSAKEDLKEEVSSEFIIEPVVEEIIPQELVIETTHDENLSISTDDVKESTENEPVQDQITDDSESTATEFENEPIQQFFIEPTTNDDLTQNAHNEEEDKLVSLLETNPLDDEYTENIENFSVDDIFNNIQSYEDIKNQQHFDAFETPYLFHGKNSERVRYRLNVPSKRNRKKNRIKRSFMSWIITILVAIFIAMFLRTFVFLIATVNGPSMLPTLEDNEKLFVTKYTYKFSEIERGDVVICKYGTEAYPDIYVKRVIALGGEVVSIVDGKVLINNVELEENYVLAPCVMDMDPVYVPQGYVFVMGDNRNNSADSRKVIIGPLKEDLIIGKVQFRITPFQKFGSLEDKQ